MSDLEIETPAIDHYPTPDDLLAAFRTLVALGQAIYHDEEWERVARMKTWEKVIEARLSLAQVTSALIDDPADPYGVAWQKMVDES